MLRSFAVENGLTGVELVLAYQDPALDVTLPLEKPAGILNDINPAANPWRSTFQQGGT